MPDTRGSRGAAKMSGGDIGNDNEEKVIDSLLAHHDKKWNEKYHQLKKIKENVCIKYF